MHVLVVAVMVKVIGIIVLPSLLFTKAELRDDAQKQSSARSQFMGEVRARVLKEQEQQQVSPRTRM